MNKTPLQLVFEFIKKGESERLLLMESVLMDNEKRLLNDCFYDSRVAHPVAGFEYPCFEDWYNEMFNFKITGSDEDIDKQV